MNSPYTPNSTIRSVSNERHVWKRKKSLISFQVFHKRLYIRMSRFHRRYLASSLCDDYKEMTLRHEKFRPNFLIKSQTPTAAYATPMAGKFKFYWDVLRMNMTILYYDISMRIDCSRKLSMLRLRPKNSVRGLRFELF